MVDALSVTIKQKLIFLLLVPRSAVGTYGLASVRVSARPADISKSAHRIFLFLAQS